jgi:hypothetical protein
VTADHLPHFSIIQEDIREKDGGSRKHSQRISSRKKNTENLDFDVAHFKSIDFFSFLNAQAMLKCNKSTKKSASLNKQHKNSKYAGIHLGAKEEKEFAEITKAVYNEGQDQMKTSQHEKRLMKLMASSNTLYRGLSNLPLAAEDSIKVAIKGGQDRLNLFESILKNNMGDNKILKQNFLGDKVDKFLGRGITGINPSSTNRKDKSEMRGLVIDQLQTDAQNKKKSRDRSTSKNLPIIMSKNKKLNSAYLREKRKLELEMMKMNEKMGTTAKILNLIRYDKSPTPMYKFKDFKDKLARIRQYQEAKRGRLGGKGNKIFNSIRKNRKNKLLDSSNSSIITENFEPSESGSDA